MSNSLNDDLGTAEMRFPDGAPPCFYWRSCRRYARVEKQGKSLCRECAERLKGVPYALRPPTREPLHPSGRAAAEALDMVERGRRRLNRTG